MEMILLFTGIMCLFMWLKMGMIVFIMVIWIIVKIMWRFIELMWFFIGIMWLIILIRQLMMWMKQLSMSTLYGAFHPFLSHIVAPFLHKSPRNSIHLENETFLGIIRTLLCWCLRAGTNIKHAKISEFSENSRFVYFTMRYGVFHSLEFFCYMSNKPGSFPLYRAQKISSQMHEFSYI